MSGHRLEPTILREYDIRGIIGETLSTNDAFAIGRAFGTTVAEAGGKSVCVGYDGRLSSPELEAAVVDGLVACGLKAVRIGLGPTPMLYFAVHVVPADAGIMISGSHNPPDYNGFKMMMGKGPFYGDDIQRLGEIAAAGTYASGSGEALDWPAHVPYVDRLVADYRGDRPLRVAWDAGNGAAGTAMVDITARLPGTHILINEVIDGTFPAHHPALSAASGSGEALDWPAHVPYVDRLVADYRGDRPLRVAWDAGNGAAGTAMVDITARLPGTHILINEVIDGTFPAHHPDPTLPECLEQLQDVVSRESCDLGLAFDGDGDRIGAIDGQGRILWGDQLMVLLAADVLKEHPGATVIADVKASQTLFDEVARMGGNPLMWRTGHSLIKAKMAETGAPLAGEMSGHIFFADKYFGYDDGLYAAVRLLGYLSSQPYSLAQLRDRLPQPVNTPELRFPCSDTRKFDVIEEVRGRVAANGSDVIDIDGLRVSTADGWWLLRASNTQDVLVARCEAKDQAGLARLRDALVDQLVQSGIEPPQF